MKLRFNARFISIVFFISASGCTRCGDNHNLALPQTGTAATEASQIANESALAESSSQGVFFGVNAKIEVLPKDTSAASVVAHLFDNDLNTAWISSEQNFAKSTSLHFTFKEELLTYGFSYIPGYARDYSSLKEYAIPNITVDGEGSGGSFEFSPCKAMFETEIAWSSELSEEFEEPFAIPTSRIENISYRYLVYSEPVHASKINLRVPSTLASIGVKPQVAISHFNLLTEANLKSSRAFKLYQFIKDQRNLKVFESLPVRLPLQAMECANQSYYARATSQMVATREGVYFRDLNGKHLAALVRSFLSGSNRMCYKDSSEFIYVDTGHQQRLIFANWPDGTISSSCWSDGEGGTQFVVAVVFENDHPTAFEVTARLDQKP